ncbi:DUF3536 domain-containing protein, partial [Desulfovibrio sp. OttesenSCG-928-G15]|nr:DUF3536 domain-containing protein [Desulfovibrio sp. OttesenSCG-928-G15]
MSVWLCIHGHYYQPPRENPWFGVIPAEPSAAPMRNWNERIMRESYSPLAWARRLNSDGHIQNLINCYEWTSFNAGPTLLRWMRNAYPEVLARMVEADRKSVERWGHGNAIAQVYHHIIMPLAPEEDKELEVRWAIEDFQHYFGRQPEGMWLSECAVDTSSLEVLARHGIRFVILAPRQAKAVVANGVTSPVNETSLNKSMAYKVALPSGRTIAAVFYDGPLSQSIAFEGLLRNGENFWQRISGAAAGLREHEPGAPLLAIATDGETYGHHFTFGEMALAYVLEQGIAKRDDILLTNIGSYIEAIPPIHEVVLHEPSSWSCVHGVERWRSDCGCKDGGHGDWNQKWRKPLRDALDLARNAVNKHFFTLGNECFTDVSGALAAYGGVLADPAKSDDFAATWFKPEKGAQDTAWKLLSMQEHSLASFASCAWFFDDLARIEPVNSMAFALRSLDLLKETGGPGMVDAFAAALGLGCSNQLSCGTGEDVFRAEVIPRRVGPAKLGLWAWLLLYAQGRLPQKGQSATHEWPEVSVTLTPGSSPEKGTHSGSMLVRARREKGGTRYLWRMETPGDERAAGQPFRFLAEARMFVQCAEGDARPETSCAVSEFSRPDTEALLAACLKRLERANRPQMQALAAHVASLVIPWDNSQHDIIGPAFWVGFMPYLALECMVNESLDDAQRMQVQAILAMHLSERSKELSSLLICEALADCLQSAGMDRSGNDASLDA